MHHVDATINYSQLAAGPTNIILSTANLSVNWIAIHLNKMQST